MQNNIYDEDIIFINRSKFTSEEFLKVNVILNRRATKVFFVVGIAGAITTFVCALYLSIVGYGKKLLIDAALAGGLAIFCFAMRFISPLLLKKNKLANRAMNYELHFYDDRMKVNLSGDDVNSTEVKNYKDIIYARELGDYLFFYITRYNAYVMKKDANYERIVEFLKSKNIMFKK